ncbi:hypothetical protein [Methanolobus psychrotolerans]|nr:hypothetical protein [Methanolobus psychrotolerans]
MNLVKETVTIWVVILVLTMMPASASYITYNIRSTVYDSSDSFTPAGDFY